MKNLPQIRIWPAERHCEEYCFSITLLVLNGFLAVRLINFFTTALRNYLPLSCRRKNLEQNSANTSSSIHLIKRKINIRLSKKSETKNTFKENLNLTKFSLKKTPCRSRINSSVF